jgi:anti-sigma28 factor (negative regulator of flagellin synthesis)
MGALNFPSRSKNMATSKKTSTKKSAKKRATKKAAAAGGRVKLNFPIDEARIEAIKRCLARGTLQVTVSKADLLRGRLGDPYQYD